MSVILRYRILFYCLVLVFLESTLSSCKQETLPDSITLYADTTLHGRYNNSGFNIQLDKVPAHKKIQVSFDLYLHDSWDGNDSQYSGPDLWQMIFDNNLIINTTFANQPCEGFECGSQSYPANFPLVNYPRTGEVPINLKGACIWGERGTSLYRITRFVKHSGTTINIRFQDKLIEKVVPTSLQLCHESWSMDNIEIKAGQ